MSTSLAPDAAAALWGRILALLEAASPAALADATRAAFFARPAERLAGIALGATAMTARLKMLLDAAYAEIDEVPKALDAEAQANAYLAYSRTRAALGRREASPRPSRGEWDLVDWSLRDAEIARHMGVTRAAVLRQRRKRAL